MNANHNDQQELQEKPGQSSERLPEVEQELITLKQELTTLEQKLTTLEKNSTTTHQELLTEIEATKNLFAAGWNTVAQSLQRKARCATFLLVLGFLLLLVALVAIAWIHGQTGGGPAAFSPSSLGDEKTLLVASWPASSLGWAAAVGFVGLAVAVAAIFMAAFIQLFRAGRDEW